MFAKLLKYDFRSTKKMGLIMLLFIAGSSVLGGASVISIVKLVQSEVISESVIFKLMMIMLIMTCAISVITLISSFIVMFIYICVNFYKSLVTDEGYLTFTLPVKSKDILLSKIVNGIIWLAITVLAIIVALILVGLLVLLILNENPIEFIKATFQEIYTLFEDIIDSGFVFNIFMMIVNLILSGIVYLLLCFAAIFTGSVIVKKNKALAAFGLVYGFNTVYRIIYSGVYFMFILIPVSTSASGSIEDSFFFGGINIILVLLKAAISVAFFLITKNLMEKHVNLP